METKAKTVTSVPLKPAVKVGVSAGKTTGAVSKAPITANKSEVSRQLKDAAKVTTTICGDIKKKIMNHKSAALPEITEVNGINKVEMMKMIELLDGMGTTTYGTVCELRELYNKMK